MNAQNEENLKELFEKFVDTEQAETNAEDIREGERILREYPAPEPGGELIAEIKGEIARALLGRKADTFKRIAYKTAAIAAVFIILAGVSIRLFEKGGDGSEKLVTTSIIPTAIWESDDIAADDADMATLIAEIEQIESEALALRLAENGGDGYGDLSELEMEFVEINSDFWKG